MKKLLVLAVLAGGAGTAALFWPGRSAESIVMDVRQGSSAYQVGQDLRERGAIGVIYPYLIWTRLRGAGSRLKVGRYQFVKGRSAYWIVDDLVNGRTMKVKVVIPEGFASWQIAQRLAEAQVCGKDEFLQVVREKNLEGFLFPATYDLDIGYEAASVAQHFRRAFDQKWNSEMDERARQIGFTQKQVVTLASIIQREVADPSEYGLVSSVYHNRLKKQMPLQADPTVQYALGYWKQRLLFSDYRTVSSPYNTYLVSGLPPGPICSPGVDAINAALNPSPSDYLYFVAAADGRHTFSVNYREHANKVNIRNRSRKRK